MKKLYFIILCLALFSCKVRNSFEVKDFNPYSNFSCTTDTLHMEMDLSNAISNGITIPSENGKSDQQYFKFSFSVKNNSGSPKAFFYKVYYQNESYKMQEFAEKEVGKSKEKKNVYNDLSSNNFYGSWENSADEFHKTIDIPDDDKFYEIKDSFRIVGNPRDEEKYFGSETKNNKPTAFRINKAINNILVDAEWLAKIKEKALNNKTSLNEQLYLDALWTLDHEREKGDVNNRWKRNPRTGNYSFLIVVTDENGIKNIPVSVKNIGMIDTSVNNYMNPYYYFLHSFSETPDGVFIERSKKVLRTKATLNPSKGIFVDMCKYREAGADTSNFSDICGDRDKLFYEAQFEQYFHNINKNFKLINIPIVFDVVNDNYSQELYNLNKKNYENKKLPEKYISIAKSLAKNVGYDKLYNAIFIKNPGNKNTNNYAKENTGVNTRIGFTYGKYRAKIKFPEMLSSDNVWNGITCAFWLLYQDDASWNNRNICVGDGYIPKGENGKTDNRVTNTNYSEIDIEIVKTSKFWPKTSYGKQKNIPSDDPAANDNLIVACTNWDLACKEPSKYNVGVKSVNYKGKEYDLHRWDDWYKALTSKYSDTKNNIAGNEIYYEIDWQPEKIIWRIGRSKDDMKIIGYMDSSYTKIPDNQMIAVITQEFHDASWWPLAPWDQNFIPYPKNDIFGYIYEIEIE